jgi:hypothetical protein
MYEMGFPSCQRRFSFHDDLGLAEVKQALSNLNSRVEREGEEKVGEMAREIRRTGSEQSIDTGPRWLTA